jgi:hypothetical protein
VRDQVLQPYKTTGRNIVLYTLIFRFLEIRQEDKYFELEVGSISECSLLQITS